MCKKEMSLALIAQNVNNTHIVFFDTWPNQINVMETLHVNFKR